MTTPLSSDLRNLLAKAIQQARRAGEAGARQALEALAVNRAKPFESTSPEATRLRRQLRDRGRQLRDPWDRKTGMQKIGHLAHEVACEHWHRMLFARFLAENGLLRDPDYGADMSLEDCRELARERGVDPWEIAGRCAEDMLPAIFRRDDPVLSVSLPPETRQVLERLLDSLPEAVFTAPDSLGWTYQFWQAERKGEVNKSGRKIGADELPAVTQLFTERYMVHFLLHNTIGAWRAGKLLADRPDLAANAVNEEELRRLARLEAGRGYDFSYLRFVRDAREGDEDGQRTGPWRPAAGPFADWPRDAAGLRVLDPCCGSGHFLVEAFELLVRLRMADERLPVAEAIRLVLRDNIFGLEIESRCTQIAAFNLALAAWRLAGEAVELPPLNIACAGLAPSGSEDSWVQIAERLEATSGMGFKRDLFGGDPSLHAARSGRGWPRCTGCSSRPPSLGSLLDPRSLGSDLFRADFKSLRELLDVAIQQERGLAGRDEEAVAAAGMARAAEILRGQYTLVVTNVPFLARGKQGGGLRSFAETNHGDAKGDIATVFVSRIFGWLGKHGTQAVVSPQNWLFLTTYRKLRERLLKRRTWNVVARLGPGAFETITGEVVNVGLTILSAEHPGSDWEMAGVDVSSPRGQRPIKAAEKGELLRGGAGVVMSRQAEQLKNPDYEIELTASNVSKFLREVARTYQGIATSDNPAYVISFWELSSLGDRWNVLQSSPSRGSDFLGREQVLRCSFLLPATCHKGNVSGSKAWNRDGVAVSETGRLWPTRFTGQLFICNNHVVVPIEENESHLAAVWCFCKSGNTGAFHTRQVSTKLAVKNAYPRKIPFDLDHWEKVAAEQYPNGLPEPYSDDPTQWIFHGHPCRSIIWDETTKRTIPGPHRIDATVLHVAVARLLGYRWPAELDPNMRLAAEQRAVAEDCRAFDQFADDDGIVCISATHGETNAADRLRALLSAAYGGDWSTATERALLAATSTRSKPPKSLEDWLCDRFFKEHCQLFHNRPFIWHIWDGHRDGFQALVNYHRLAGPDGAGRQTLEALAFAYVNDWIRRQRAAVREETPGADARLAAALNLQEQLQRILDGEPPCDLFVRWRPLHGQAIGWEPDINDGVRLNIRPFMRAELRKGGRKGAGILRWKPNISWKKDRGKEPEEPRPCDDFPWFWGCPGGGSEAQRTDFTAPPNAIFDGNRWNDLHYTRAAKEAAREARRGQSGPAAEEER